MKKQHILNSSITRLIGTLGHTDEFTVGDCGLPIPPTVERIDLALIRGIPSFMQTVDAILCEEQIEAVTLATEFPQISPDLHQQFLARIQKEENLTGHKIQIHYVSHEALKQQSQHSKAIVRTGECTAYANAIFSSGVAFTEER